MKLTELLPNFDITKASVVSVASSALVDRNKLRRMKKIELFYDDFKANTRTVIKLEYWTRPVKDKPEVPAKDKSHEVEIRYLSDYDAESACWKAYGEGRYRELEPKQAQALAAELLALREQMDPYSGAVSTGTWYATPRNIKRNREDLGLPY